MADGGSRLGSWLLGGGAVLGLTLAAGRLTGLLREVEIASHFGVSRSGDLAVLFLTIPDLLVNLLLSGGLSAALVPRLRMLPIEQAAALFKQALAAVSIAFGLAAAAFAIWPSAVFAVLAPGLNEADLSTHWPAIVLVALAMPLTAAAGVTAARLNAHGRFFVAGMGTLIFNLCIVASLWLTTARAGPVLVLAGGIAGGALLRLASQLAALTRVDWDTGPPRGRIDPLFVKSFAAAAGAASMMLLVPIAVRAMASLTGSGAIASFNYATKLVELPVGILIGAASTVALTHLSELHARGDAVAAGRIAVQRLQRTVLLACAVAVPGIYFADAAVAALLARGQMTGPALDRVTGLTRIALAGIPCVAISGIAAAALNAAGRSSSVLRPTMWAVLALPALALPGLLVGSEQWLMGAVVAFQLAHCILLLRASGLPTLSEGGWLAPTIAIRLAFIAMLTAGSALLDHALAAESVWVRLSLAGLALALGAAAAALRSGAKSLPGDLPHNCD